MPRRKADHYQTALESWNEGLSRLGESIVHFQHIEEVLSRCIIAMLSRDRTLGDIVTAELSFRAKVGVYTALFLYRSKLRALPKDVSEVLGRVRAAEQRRNTIVHSLWDASIKDPTMIKREKRSCGKAGLNKVLEHIRPSELEDDIKEFENVAEDLLYVTDEHLPKESKRFK